MDQNTAYNHEMITVGSWLQSQNIQSTKEKPNPPLMM